MPVSMVNFLFWNINRRPLESLVAEIASSQRVDLLMLAECDIHPTALLDILNAARPMFRYIPVLSRGFELFATFSPDFLTPLYDSDKITIQRLSLPARLDVLLCIVHLPSKLRWSGESQALECTRLARIIREVEARVRHERTVLVGDLNMNPFEAGVVGAAGFNATMARQVASRGSRSVQGERYPFFYNPMWGHFGDHRGNAGGSYYYDSGQHVNYYWNVFDQVLVRAELIPRFPVEELRIIASTPSRTLLSQQGRPDGKVGSDHLPLLFKLDL